jgi:glucans biosynthesis protein C
MIIEKRIYWIDWIRIFSTIFMAIYHITRNFDFQITDMNLGDDITLDNFSRFLTQVLIPMFFYLSGYSLNIMNEREENKNIIKEKIQKLIIPGVSTIFTFVMLERFVSYWYHSKIELNAFYNFVFVFFQNEFSLSQTWFLFALFFITIKNISFLKGIDEERIGYISIGTNLLFIILFYFFELNFSFYFGYLAIYIFVYFSKLLKFKIDLKVVPFIIITQCLMYLLTNPLPGDHHLRHIKTGKFHI